MLCFDTRKAREDLASPPPPPGSSAPARLWVDCRPDESSAPRSGIIVSSIFVSSRILYCSGSTKGESSNASGQIHCRLYSNSGTKGERNAREEHKRTDPSAPLSVRVPLPLPGSWSPASAAVSPGRKLLRLLLLPRHCFPCSSHSVVLNLLGAKEIRSSGRKRVVVRKYQEKKKAHMASLEEEVVHLKALNQQLVKKLQNHDALATLVLLLLIAVHLLLLMLLCCSLVLLLLACYC